MKTLSSVVDVLNMNIVPDKSFALRLAFHHKRLIQQGLIEIGCLESPVFFSELKANEDSKLNSQSSESFSHERESPSTSMEFDLPRNRVDNRIYQVQFKFGIRHCYNRSGHCLNIGDFVVVDITKDQMDLGVMTRYYAWEHFESRRVNTGKFNNEDENILYEIVRLASEQERIFLPHKHEQEELLLKICQHLAENVYCLPMNIFGVEFQFDGNKVSVFFTSEARIDYQDLVKEIFQYCKVHVWMRRTNRNYKFRPLAFATAALITGLSQR